MTSSRYTDTFLDSLRQLSDIHADEAFALMAHDDELACIRSVFGEMDANDERPPLTLFPRLHTFLQETAPLPPEMDLDRIHRGEEVFEHHPFTGALVLLAKSLPEGYQAPNLSIVLNMSGDLRSHPYRRLLATLQTVVNVSTCHGFTPQGRAVITAQKLRLLHAGIRYVVDKHRPDFRAKYGIPVNQEDMLATVLGFSLLVIEGWRTLNVGVTPAQEEDFLYLWCSFARMMGIHPHGEPFSQAFIPRNVAEAQEFYRAYERRHYVGAAENPDGVMLAAASIDMLRKGIPPFLRFLGFGILPRIYLNELMGNDACAALGVPVLPGHKIIKWILVHVHRLIAPFEYINPDHHAVIGMIIFQHLITHVYGGMVTFTVPDDLAQLKGMVETPTPQTHY